MLSNLLLFFFFFFFYFCIFSSSALSHVIASFQGQLSLGLWGRKQPKVPPGWGAEGSQPALPACPTLSLRQAARERADLPLNPLTGRGRRTRGRAGPPSARPRGPPGAPDAPARGAARGPPGSGHFVGPAPLALSVVLLRAGSDRGREAMAAGRGSASCSCSVVRRWSGQRPQIPFLSVLVRKAGAGRAGQHASWPVQRICSCLEPKLSSTIGNQHQQ